MKLTVKELRNILEIAERLDVRAVDIEMDNSSGIGSVVTAKYPVVIHEDLCGEFEVTITGPESW